MRPGPDNTFHESGGHDKSPKNRPGMMVPSLTFGARCGRSRRRWDSKESLGARRGWAPRPLRTCYSPEDNTIWDNVWWQVGDEKSAVQANEVRPKEDIKVWTWWNMDQPSCIVEEGKEGFWWIRSSTAR